MKWLTRRVRERPGPSDVRGSREAPGKRAPVGGPLGQRAPFSEPPGAGDYEAWKRQVEAEARRRLKQGIRGVGERG